MKYNCLISILLSSQIIYTDTHMHIYVTIKYSIVIADIICIHQRNDVLLTRKIDRSSMASLDLLSELNTNSAVARLKLSALFFFQGKSLSTCIFRHTCTYGRISGKCHRRERGIVNAKSFTQLEIYTFC